MTKVEIERLINPFVRRRTWPLEPPAEEDWRRLRVKFETDFPDEFISLQELLAEYWFSGGFLDVARRPPADLSDSIEVAYDHEMSSQGYAVPWDPDLIPFYDVGNGDYCCLSAKRGKSSPVYFVDHEDSSITEEATSFVAWVEELPEFLRD